MVGPVWSASCARAPSLISVLGRQAPGDMMVDGVIPLWGSVAAARSFRAAHRVVVAAAECGEPAAAHRLD